MQSEDWTTADKEIGALLADNPRDASTLVLQGALLNQQGEIARSLGVLSDALRIDSSLAGHSEILAAVVEGYKHNRTRKTADQLVEQTIQHAAIPALTQALRSEEWGDRKARHAVASRLEKLGAGEEVDWALLAMADLKSSSCGIKKAAISKLLAQGDERAVGPLMKVAESRSCGAKQAKSAANAILAK